MTSYRNTCYTALIVCCALLLAACSEAPQQARKQVEVQASGWGKLKYELPPAGSYALAEIMPAADGEIVLSDGSTANLREYFDGEKATIITFLYTQCSDLNGCPLATFVLHSLQKALHKRPDLKDSVRFISLSFDPANDTVDVMRQYSEEFKHKKGYEWLFATTKSKDQLKPILDGYGQFVFETVEQDGSRSFAHILRAYLVDSKGIVRNIYSVDFLHPKILLADIETLAQEKETLRADSATQ